MAKVMWVVTVFMSAIGAFIAFFGVVGAKGAPQEAAAAAIGLTCAIIPYCIARALTEIRAINRN